MNFTSGTRRSESRSASRWRTNPAARSSAFCGLLALGGVADDGPVDARQREVAGDLGAGHRDEADARIANLGGQHLADLLANLFLDALDAVRESHGGSTADS